MIKLYLHLHNANLSLKKQLFTAGLLLFLMPTGNYVNAQCIPAPVVNAVANQVFCKNTATAAINFTGTATSYNWTNNNVLIGLAASGTGSIASFTAANASTVPIVATILVTPVDGICTGTAISFTITIKPLPVVTVTPTISCGGSPSGTGPCNPLTATGADSYIWSPLTGLYTNCTSTVPYTGTNTATVFAAPIFPTLYTVTGTDAVTGCSNTITAYVNNTPPTPIVTPSAVTMCLGSAPVKLKAMPNFTGTSQFCSGPVNIAVPDNNLAGVSNSIAVTGIPVPATITGISVTINMPHTRIGDMVFVLKAPNGNILNLDHLLGATGGSGATTGFANTIISSAGTASLNTGTNPYTGTFRPDAAGGASTPPAGPTGFAPTVANFAGLYSTINGSWTLAFYDAVTNEVGTLSSWCISLTYSGIISANSTAAVWSPAAGLFFDAAATTPYTAGTAIDSVWVWPFPAGVYTYQVTTQSLTVAGFTNPAAIIIPDAGAANPYPATVTVSGLPQTGATVKSVVLHGFNHTYSEDVDILLQSPLGQNVTLMSDVGAGTLVNGTYTFADAGPFMSNSTINPAGTYHPTNDAGVDSWPAPGPGGVAQASPALSMFTPSNNNGTWKLFVMDDNAGDQGIISGGFTINFNVGAPACTSPPRTVVVTVGVPAVITTQPVNQNICIGSNATFSVAGAGTGLSYQWQVSVNGGATFSNIVNAGLYSGATSAALTITSPPFGMSGNRYKVIVNGATACAAATSNIAILTVNPLPVVTLSADPFYKLLPGLTTTIFSAVTPNAAVTYAWFLDGNIIPGATADTIFVDFSGIGLYKLQVTDINGCTAVSDTVRIKDSSLGRMFVYPNPSNGNFQVRLYLPPNTVSARTLTLYDNMGHKVLSKPYTQTNSYQQVVVDTRTHGKGLYWVEVTDADGKRMGISKVLIQ